MKTLHPEILIGAGHGLRFTESPRWHEERWWFLDIHDSAIKAVTMDGTLETILSLPFKPNGFGFRPDGGMLFSDALNLRMMYWDGTVLHPYADLSSISVFCLSDGIVDANGRMFIGDIGYNFWDASAKPSDNCAITRIDPDAGVHKVADGLSFPNGMAITPDGGTLVVAETNGFCLTAFDLSPQGDLSNRRIFAALGEGVQPDGICMDQAGGIWIANPAAEQGKAPGVLRVEEGGRVTHGITLDTHAYAVMLGGPEQRHLFISTSASHDPAEIAVTPSAALYICAID
jgi:sugar lactone lactonase YvrE